MKNIPLEKLLVEEQQTLRDALQVIDRVGSGVCFVVKPESRSFVGLMTDGDIRRAILAGHPLDTPVEAVVQRKVTTLPLDTPVAEIQAQLSERIKHIPLLDSKGDLVDYASFTRLHRIPVLEPLLSGNELAYVTDCVRTGWISSQGKYVTRFERAFEELFPGYHAVAVSNGTVALHLALVSAGIGPGDEVIVPDITFAASINAVLHAGATPVIADIDPRTWTLAPESVARLIGPATRAIMPVHLYGQVCDMDALLELARQHHLFVLEDAAEAIGSTFRGQLAGGLADSGTFSFFGNKTITTGEGGMVVFKSEAQADQARILRDHGMTPGKRYWHGEVGFNYRMTNMQAAIGVAQIERLHELVNKKRSMAARYDALLNEASEIQSQQTTAQCASSYWLYTVLLPGPLANNRDNLLRRLLAQGIECRPMFYALHQMPPYQQFRSDGSLQQAQHIAERGLSLPSSVGLQAEEQARVIRHLKELVEEKLFINKSTT